MVNGIPWTRPPGWLDPDRRLIRNTFHDHLDQARRFGTQTRLDLDAEDTAIDAERATAETRRRRRRPAGNNGQPGGDDPGGQVT
jgi:hypothetical protein